MKKIKSIREKIYSDMWVNAQLTQKQDVIVACNSSAYDVMYKGIFVEEEV